MRGATWILKDNPDGFQDFNPRAPCGARPRDLLARRPIRVFQSTRPVRGATLDDLQPYKTVKISIHAPRAGRDGAEQVGYSSTHDFNPRAPCGARPGQLKTVLESFIFQSTRPVRGATYF